MLTHARHTARLTGTYYVRGVVGRLARRQSDQKPFQVWQIYLVDRVDAPVWQEMTSTTDAFKASLAKRAGELKRAITLSAKETRWGYQIETIEMGAV